MKKFLRYILIILIAFCLNFSNKTIFASENNEYSLQVERGEYSDEILDYIRNNWENFFGRDELKKFLGSDIIVGEPYGIYSVDEDKFIATKFPIYVKGNCVQVLDVFENPKTGKLTWAASTDKDFMKVIDDLNKKTGKYRFETKYSSTGGADTFDIVKIEEQGFRSFKDAIYSDISKPLLKIKVRNISEKPTLRSSNYPVEKILPMDPKESQDNKPWCAAYAGARILSYEFSKDIRARDIMEWVYWSFWNKPNLDDKSLSDTDLIKYAKHLGSNPYYVDRSLYREEIMDEICNYRMIYAGGRNLNNPKGLHAMVVYGYEKDKYYYYWNPWGESGLKSSMDSNIMKTRNGTMYDWIDSIRNFTWN